MLAFDFDMFVNFMFPVHTRLFRVRYRARLCQLPLMNATLHIKVSRIQHLYFKC